MTVEATAGTTTGTTAGPAPVGLAATVVQLETLIEDREAGADVHAIVALVRSTLEQDGRTGDPVHPPAAPAGRQGHEEGSRMSIHAYDPGGSGG